MAKQRRNTELEDQIDGFFQRAIGHCVMEDQKASGTFGGTFTNGAWQTRDLNTVMVDTIGVTLAGNAFTIPRGVYEVHISAPAAQCNHHQTRLYDVTNAAVVLNGTSELATAIQIIAQTSVIHSQTRSFIYGRIYVSAATQFRVEHQCATTSVNRGFGWESGAMFAVAHETYTVVELHKVS